MMLFTRVSRGARASFVVALVALTVGAAVAPGRAGARAPAGQGSGLEPVAAIPFAGGTHLLTATIKGRDYAFAAAAVPRTSTEPGKVRVIDISRPARPRVVAEVACGTYQGHLQLSHDQKTLILGVDVPAVAGSCMPTGAMGFVTIDVSDPRRPRPIGYADIPRGSHSTAAHPTKPYVYNADGDVVPTAAGEMQIWSIKNPARPRLVGTLATGGHSPHDLSFNAEGTLAATANISALMLLDTRDPADPAITWTSQCPGCQHTHEARFTPDGSSLVVNDEAIPAPYPCPGGALYFYDVVALPTGPGLSLTGAYAPDAIATTPSGGTGFCTSHSFDISRDGSKVAASWHAAGLRLLDISQRSGTTIGDTARTPGGATELGWYAHEDGDTFTAKFHEGPFVYTVDAVHGFEVYRVARP